MIKENLLKKANKIRAKTTKLEEEFADLVENCPHDFIEMGCGVAYCKICGRDDFWWCDKSPDHVCHYDGDDCCNYCGRSADRDSSGYSIKETQEFFETGKLPRVNFFS